MTTDPRKLGGGIAGPGGPYDRGGVLDRVDQVRDAAHASAR